MLPPDTLALVRQTWRDIEPTAERVSARFYDVLFTASPGLVPLFGDNMSDQGDKLMQMIGFAVRELGEPEVFAPALHALGRRHAGYGVRDEHYDAVGAAFLQALAYSLGERFTPPVRQAWADVYRAMAEAMQAGAHAEPPPPDGG